MRKQILAVGILSCCAVAAHAAVEVGCGLLQSPQVSAVTAIGYFTVRNTSDEKLALLKITSPIADSIHLQQASVDAQGVEHQWPVASLELQPGQTVRFAPDNGRHLVLEGLSKPVRAGMRVPVTLQFDHHERPVTVLMIVQSVAEVAKASCTR